MATRAKNLQIYTSLSVQTQNEITYQVFLSISFANLTKDIVRNIKYDVGKSNYVQGTYSMWKLSKDITRNT